jgi:pilus assembly protein FimV
VKIEPEAAAAFAADQTVSMAPEGGEQARDLGIEIDLSALDTPSPVQPETSIQPPVADQTADISFDFQLPADLPTDTVVPPAPDLTTEVPATDIAFDVPEIKPAPASGAMDFALETVSLDLGEPKAVSEVPAPIHDDHWMDIQTKFDLAKAYEEMGDKDGAREILQEVIKEGDAQQQAEATALLAKLG